MTPTPYRCLYKNVPFTDEEWARRNANYAQIRLANVQAPQSYLDRWKTAQTRPVHPWRWGEVFSSEESAIEHCEEAFVLLHAQQTEYFHCYDETVRMAFTRYGWRNKYRKGASWWQKPYHSR